MDYSPNLLAVLVASLLPQLIGALWYGPLFGKMWMTLVGKTEEELREGFNPWVGYGVTWLLGVVAAFVLAHVLNTWEEAFAATGWAYGMQGAFWMWLGFVVFSTWQAVAFEDKKFITWGLNLAYNLTALLAMGALLGEWR